MSSLARRLGSGRALHLHQNALERLVARVLDHMLSRLPPKRLAGPSRQPEFWLLSSKVMISDAIALYELLSKKWGQYKIISALFKWNGTRVEGDGRIEIELHSAENDTWFYSVKEVPEYVFIWIPVNAGGVIEKAGAVGGEKSADASYFRYIPVPDGRIYGGTIPNVKVDFMVIGYRPKDLLHIHEAAPPAG
jgi:hypothetical protein